MISDMRIDSGKPFEDKVAGASEQLVMEYNSRWTGGRETLKPIDIPAPYLEHFDLNFHTEFPVSISFTRESWHGRMRACRGVGASLTDTELQSWDAAHRALLEKIAPEQFEIKHYIFD